MKVRDIDEETLKKLPPLEAVAIQDVQRAGEEKERKMNAFEPVLLDLLFAGLRNQSS